MTRGRRWGSGLAGVLVAGLAFWAVLAPGTVRSLVMEIIPDHFPAAMWHRDVGQARQSGPVCQDSFEWDEGRALVDPRPAANPGAPGGPVRREGRSGPMARLGPDATLHDYLAAEVSYLTVIRQLERERRDTVTRLWAARAMRRRALASLEVADRRLAAQKRRVQRRSKDLSAFYEVLYKLVDGWQDIPLLDRRRSSPPLDGRMELLAIIEHLKGELESEQRVLADLRARRERDLAAMRRAKDTEARLDALRDTLGARIARAGQELSDLRRLKEHRNRSREVWDKRARRLHRAVVELEQDVLRESQGFETLKGKLLRPVPGVVLPYPKTKGHGAVLVGAEPGWSARAPASGKVVFAGPVPGFGNVVIIDHGEGYSSVVGYLSRLTVTVGQRVRAGRPLGRVANPGGLSTRKRRFCYYELRRSGVPLDPFDWLRFSGRRRRAPRLRRLPKGMPDGLPRAVADRLIPVRK